MKNEKQILEEVDKTLSALDNMPKLEANPFLYTRIQTKMAETAAVKNNLFLVRFKVKYVVLVIIIILNVLTIVNFFEKNHGDYSKDQLIYSLRQEYNSSQNEF
jgi:hypothetical protein